jgi:MraZ protein
MFQGETAITLDDKGRLAVPTAYRELIASACANRLVFTYNPFEHGCLWLFPHGEWEKVRDQVNMLPSVKRVHRDLQLKLVGAATTVEADGNARLLVPASQRAAAGIEMSDLRL